MEQTPHPAEFREENKLLPGAAKYSFDMLFSPIHQLVPLE